MSEAPIPHDPFADEESTAAAKEALVRLETLLAQVQQRLDGYLGHLQGRDGAPVGHDASASGAATDRLDAR